MAILSHDIERSFGLERPPFQLAPCCILTAAPAFGVRCRLRSPDQVIRTRLKGEISAGAAGTQMTVVSGRTTTTIVAPIYVPALHLLRLEIENTVGSYCTVTIQ